MKIRKTIASALLLFTVGLITACSGGDTPPEATTATDTPTIVANAGPDQSVFIGTFVTLNGSKSTNANQTGLTYAWTLKKPSGSNATLSDPILVNPTMTVDVEGAYEATLIVTDAQNSSKTSTPDTVIVIASKTNPPPVADVGPTSMNVFTGLPIILNGRQSRDPNGDPLTFRWSVTGKPSGSSPIFRDVTTVAPSFTPDVDGTYTVSLTVNDGTNSSTPVSVTVHASPKPSPTANAGDDQSVLTNPGTVTLNGSSSHTNPPTSPPDLQYEWTINSFSFPVTLTNAKQPIATFAVPANTAGTVVAQLKVTEPNHPDRARNSNLATVKVTVGPLATIQVSASNTPLFTCSAFSRPPCSQVAGVSSTVQTGTTLQFDATASAVQPLTYQWFVGTNSTPFSTSDKPTYLLGSSESDYTFKLIVTDLAKHQDPQSFTVNAKPGATPSFTIKPGASVGLRTMVTVTDITTGSNLTRKWTITDPLGHESTSEDLAPTFTTDKAGVYTVLLAITDKNLGAGNPNTKQITITSNNAPTVAIALLNSAPPIRCDRVDLTGAGSTDLDGDGITSYSWGVKKPDNKDATLNETDPSKPWFKADQHGTYKVSLFVTDKLGARSSTVTRNITTRGFDIFNNVSLSPIHACSECHGPKVVRLDDFPALTLQTNVQLDPTPKKDELSMGGPVTDVTALRTLVRDMADLSDYKRSLPSSCP